jgi:thiamine-phosphate pyrophosphorylase
LLLSAHDPAELRACLQDAELFLVFTPELACEREPLALLEMLLSEVDIIEVRPKAPAKAASATIASDPAAEARATFDWTRAVLDLLKSHPDAPPVLCNDRVDVALALKHEGCAGVHLGMSDLPPAEARALLGPDPLIGLSTHDLAQVLRATEEPVDYLGFGPVFPSRTKGYSQGLGPEAAWIASEGACLPLFPIGGIRVENAMELGACRRAAVGSALLASPDPPAAARRLRAGLRGGR